MFTYLHVVRIRHTFSPQNVCLILARHTLIQSCTCTQVNPFVKPHQGPCFSETVYTLVYTLPIFSYLAPDQKKRQGPWVSCYCDAHVSLLCQHSYVTVSAQSPFLCDGVCSVTIPMCLCLHCNHSYVPVSALPPLLCDCVCSATIPLCLCLLCNHSYVTVSALSPFLCDGVCSVTIPM